MKHPMQKIVVADDGTIRFRKNGIVRYLLDKGGLDMNDITRMNFSKADRRQFAQLIGYSVDGYGGLSYAQRSKSAYRADEKADILRSAMRNEKKGGRIDGRFC